MPFTSVVGWREKSGYRTSASGFRTKVQLKKVQRTFLRGFLCKGASSAAIALERAVELNHFFQAFQIFTPTDQSASHTHHVGRGLLDVQQTKAPEF